MKYKIGDTVYVANCGHRQIDIPCPVCFGKIRVTLILGNGESVSLPCDYCGKGFDGPRGYVSEYDYVAEAAARTITAANITLTDTGEKVEYRSGSSFSYYTLKEEDCYSTFEEASATAVAVKEKMIEEQNTRAEYIKEDIKKSFSWNAGYHLREAKRNRREIEYHERMAVICKERSKELVPTEYPKAGE